MLRAMRRTPRPATFDLFKRSLNTSSGLFGVAGLHSPEDWTALVTGAQARWEVGELPWGDLGLPCWSAEDALNIVRQRFLHHRMFIDYRVRLRGSGRVQMS